jgi:16S rRNA (cytosine967-C5)-methyltransferase
MQLSSLIGHTQEIFGIIIKSNRPADSLIDIFFRSHKYLGSHDRRFIAENVYGTLRHLRKCKFILNSSLNQSIESLYDEDKQLLTLIIYLFLEGKGKEITPESISSKFKSTLLRESISDIIPNFLKPIKIPNDTFTQRIGIEYSYPDWMVQKFIDQYGEAETEKICRGLNEPALLNLRVNMLKTDVEKCRE